MRIAVISDIHGNYEAFDAVVKDIERAGIETIVCLGDMVGYGPDSDKVTLAIRDRGIPTILGNHELAMIDPGHMKWFNPTARESLKKTAEMLSDDAMAYLAGLTAFWVDWGCRFVHGFPPDAISTYVFTLSDEEIVKTFEEFNEDVCFIGHTHLLEIIDHDGPDLVRAPLPRGITRLAATHRYIINIGSVGQPRDGNSDAKYILWDTEKRAIELRHIPYDIDAVVAKIKAVGLPEAHAYRLM